MQLVSEAATAPGNAADALGEAVTALVRAYKQAARHPRHAALPALELARLLEHGERRLGELAAQRYVGQPVVSRQVGELEAHGLVVRRADPADGRAGLVRLTPQGRALLDEVTQTRRRWLHRVLDGHADGDLRVAACIVGELAAQLHHLYGTEEEGQTPS